MYTLVKGTVEVVKAPDGDAPLWVRQGWLGEKLEVEAITDEAGTGVLIGMDSCNGNCYVVDQAQAIKNLELNAPNAASWWMHHGYPKNGSAFNFKASDCKIIGEIDVLKDQGGPRRHFVGMLEEGVGARDSWANVRK